MTAAEARALGHPTRLRILFACRQQPRTNKELAAALGTTPGTIHHHLRPLIEQGFLAPQPPRPGPRGSTEQPYLATGRSWELAGNPQAADALRRVAADEVAGTAGEELVTLTRVGLSLPAEELEALLARIGALIDAAVRSGVSAEASDAPEPAPTGVPVSLVLAVTRPGPSSVGGYPTGE